MDTITSNIITTIANLFPFLKKEPIAIYPITKSVTEEKFYADTIRIITRSNIPFMLGGTYAFTAHTGIVRPTKDLDVFCKAGDYTKILQALEKNGYKSEIIDPRWLAKAYHKKYFVDIIFASRTDMANVDEAWFERAPEAEVFGQRVKVVPAEELIWSKCYIQHREKYDGADINHLILKKAHDIDWKYLLNRMEAHWEILLSHLINYRFVYPNQRDYIPQWLMEELISRLKSQLKISVNPEEKITRGHLISHHQYDIDVKDWGFKDAN